MIVVIITSIIATILVLFGRIQKPDRWLKIGFVLVTFLGCIHYNYGNDYKSYYSGWETISFYSNYDILSSNWNIQGRDSFELGWVILNKIFGFDDGFYYMVAFINIIEGGIYYKFIKRFVSPQSFSWAFFLYVFTSQFYLLNFSMMRQGLAMALVLLSFIFLCNNNIKKMVLVLVIAISMHTSAIIVIPFLVLCKFVEKINAKFIAALLLFVCGFVYIASSYTEYIFNIIISMSTFEDYKLLYAGDTVKESYGLGFALLLIPYIIMIYFMIVKRKTISIEEKSMILLSFVTLLLKPFEAIGAQLIARVGYYFSVFNIAIVPALYVKINNPIIKILAYVLLLIITIYSYMMFYEDPVYRDSFSEFHSIFDL